ncbi:hypothetical protein EVAR_58843_1 [Eumeta japonica]|uniref:Uncharacterized protein n=1 Tax=Eumeta variegata TaxID=151549 RepID=A0A4C1YQR0_EUMVA|nr:hypothetical protein EVAR_58843_1 [Eumeta japonica]
MTSRFRGALRAPPASRFAMTFRQHSYKHSDVLCKPICVSAGSHKNGPNARAVVRPADASCASIIHHRRWCRLNRLDEAAPPYLTPPRMSNQSVYAPFILTQALESLYRDCSARIDSLLTPCTVRVLYVSFLLMSFFQIYESTENLLAHVQKILNFSQGKLDLPLVKKHM